MRPKLRSVAPPNIFVWSQEFLSVDAKTIASIKSIINIMLWLSHTKYEENVNIGIIIHI